MIVAMNRKWMQMEKNSIQFLHHILSPKVKDFIGRKTSHIYLIMDKIMRFPLLNPLATNKIKHGETIKHS